MKRIEALADAIAEYTTYRDPLSILYKLRNPGGLKAVSAKHPRDSQSGFRYFEKHVDGYTALVFDLEVKCGGNSKSGLKADSPLLELVRVFGMRDETARYVVKFLRKALDRPDLTEQTPINFFLE